MEVLRLLANSYKHDFSAKPTEELLKELKPESELKYASLPESDSLRKILANFIGLGDEAGYCDIAERFVDIASEYLAEVRNCTTLSNVKWGRVSLKPSH